MKNPLSFLSDFIVLFQMPRGFDFLFIRIYQALSFVFYAFLFFAIDKMRIV